jgi:hypothetical protein
MTDGRFDDDRGYIFNYAATGISASVDKSTAFLIRLAPSVSNAQTGDLGDKELLNRAQLLLQEMVVLILQYQQIQLLQQVELVQGLHLIYLIFTLLTFQYLQLVLDM